MRHCNSWEKCRRGKQKKRENRKIKGVLVMLNLPWQEKKFKVQRQRSAGSWKPKPFMSDLSTWSKAILRWILQLLLTSSEGWTSSETAEAGALSGEEMVIQKEWRWTCFMTDPCLPYPNLQFLLLAISWLHPNTIQWNLSFPYMQKIIIVK